MLNINLVMRFTLESCGLQYRQLIAVECATIFSNTKLVSSFVNISLDLVEAHAKRTLKPGLHEQLN